MTQTILGTNETLRVTADGQFIWHPDADRMIEEGDYTHSPALQFILRELRKRPQATVQVSPLEFVEMVMEKEHLVGKPLFWAEWPNKEKNSQCS